MRGTGGKSEGALFANGVLGLHQDTDMDIASNRHLDV
jgi:hypothetical protein